ncbi:MAG TPA: DNA primase [Gemmataceae bacterium]|nr:DNA primase [Gemmataceae bacterium]
MADERVAQTKQVKEANDIVEVVGSYVSLRPAGRKFKGLCPFHDDHRPSFDVDPQFQNYRCWSCGKSGDVFTFIQEHERVDFREALELLARRAGITLEKSSGGSQNSGRARMLEVVKWAAEQYHQCLLDSPLAEAARHYLGERRLTGETVRCFGLGFAPPAGDWLVQRAAQRGLPADVLEKVGLLGQRREGRGCYDRFRDRVMFPIRNVRGQPVGFGGRILPSSPLSARDPKYYNSSDSPLFSKSAQLYGLDQARQAGATAGYLAVVEGYTDVLMAHQVGIAQVVSTMGTALNAHHVQHLRRWLAGGRVVLVFDADAGGKTGVDRALETFVSQEVDLTIATLPEGMDPCDLLVQQGPEPFRAALAGAVDALEFKLNQVLAAESAAGVEGRRRAVDAVLSIIARAPDMAGQAGAVKRELVVSRIASRLGINEEAVWGRLRELRRSEAATRHGGDSEAVPAPRGAPAAPHEIELLQVLLADQTLVPVAAAEVTPAELAHPGLRRLLEGLYALQSRGEPPTLDQWRDRIDNPRLVEKALEMQEVGRAMPDRAAALRQLLAEFRKRRAEPKKQELQNQLHAASDHTEAVALLRQLQTQTVGVPPGTAPLGGAGP